MAKFNYNISEKQEAREYSRDPPKSGSHRRSCAVYPRNLAPTQHLAPHITEIWLPPNTLRRISGSLRTISSLVAACALANEAPLFMRFLASSPLFFY